MTVNRWILVQMVIIILLSFFLGYKTSQFKSSGINVLPEWLANSSIGEFALSGSTDNGLVTLKDFKDIQKVFEFMQMHFLRDDVTKKKLLEGAIAGGVSALGDRYSRYAPPAESKALQDDIEGFYQGIGIQVESITAGKGALVTTVFKGSPAYDGGVMAGDVVTQVEDKEVTDLYLFEIVGKIKGPENTKVKITVYRPTIDDTLDFTVMRKRLKNPSVFDAKILEGTKDIGYVHLLQFNTQSTADLKEAIGQLQKQGMKSLVLDLRQNTGGSFKPAVDIADIFIPDGPIVYTESRDGKLVEYDGEDGGKKLGIPLVVLVDGFSASASEILAGAIKDYKIGTILGTRTFGKGVVQNVMNLPDGGSLVLTTSKYLTPDKNDINEIGIEPDIIAQLDLPTTTDPFLKERYEKAEAMRLEIVKIRDEIMKYVRENDFQLDAAKQYLTDGTLPQGVMTAEEAAKINKAKEAKEAEKAKKAQEDKAKESIPK